MINDHEKEKHSSWFILRRSEDSIVIPILGMNNVTKQEAISEIRSLEDNYDDDLYLCEVSAILHIQPRKTKLEVL